MSKRKKRSLSILKQSEEAKYGKENLTRKTPQQVSSRLGPTRTHETRMRDLLPAPLQRGAQTGSREPHWQTIAQRAGAQKEAHTSFSLRVRNDLQEIPQLTSEGLAHCLFV